MTTFLARFDAPPGAGPAVAVKDCIDTVGHLTTVGSPAVADQAVAAGADAACVSAVRAGGGRIVGKTNLHELCFGSTGVNPWYGTPVNPLDPERIPGGSSSGSAVAVANGDAVVALGTDTTGSVRTPAACCGVAGLKTTWGRVPLDGVAALAPSLDTVGVLGVGVGALTLGMALLEPGFTMGVVAERAVGRFRAPGVDPAIDAAIDAALEAADLEVVEIDLPSWAEAGRAARTLLFGEAWQQLGPLYLAAPERIGDEVRARFELARAVDGDAVARARARQAPWRAELGAVLERVQAIALPAAPCVAPKIVDRDTAPNTLAACISLAGNPALAQPVPASAGDGLPASLQLVGRPGGEPDLLAVGARVEQAVGAGPFAAD